MNFTYVPLTFVNTEEHILFQIKSTALFHFVATQFRDKKQLSELLESTQYGFTASAQDSGNAKMIRITDIQDNSIDFDSLPHCECDKIDQFNIRKGDLLVARTGGTTGKSFIIKEVNSSNIVFASYLIRLRCGGIILPEYLHLFLNSYGYWNQISEMKSGSAQPNVNARKLSELWIPYCGIEEQKKLVNQFYSDTDYFEELSNMTQKLNLIFHKQRDVKNNSLNHFNLISKLRQAILSEAVQGKLVPQDPNDEPASVLLEKIKVEKEKLIKEKKIRKDKPLPPITEDEIPYELPKGWEWCRLGSIIRISSGNGLTSSQMNKAGDIPVFGGNGINGYHDKLNISKPTIVIGRVGFYCGSIHLTPDKAWITDNAFITSFPENSIDINFLYWLLKGTNLKEEENATAQPVISGRKVYPIIVGFPPLNEQKRIVQKIDQLMKLCDQLELQVKDNQKNAENLMNAVLREAFEV